MQAMKATTESEAKKEAKQISQDNNGYVIVHNTFGLFASVSKRLHVFAPSDSIFDWYAHNGHIKQFTTKQRIADDLATPTMS